YLRAIIILLTHLRLAGVQRDPNANGRAGWPRFGCERELHVARGRDRIGRTWEHRETAVPFAARSDQLSGVGLCALLYERIVAGHRSLHGLGILLIQAGTALDIGEQ